VGSAMMALLCVNLTSLVIATPAPTVWPSSLLEAYRISTLPPLAGVPCLNRPIAASASLRRREVAGGGVIVRCRARLHSHQWPSLRVWE
jgi:hypothetical protein